MTPNQVDLILDAAPGIYFMFDAEGRFAGWNRTYLETFGLTTADMVSFRALDVVPPDQMAHVQQAFTTVLGGTPVTIEFDLIAADGGRRTFYGTGLPVEHEGRPHISGLAVDISERKQAEARLRRNHEILECVSRLLALYVRDSDAEAVFTAALGDILRLTGSQYGFIAELKHETDGSPYLQSLAITKMDWDASARRFYDENAPSGFRFSTRDSLAAAVLDGAPVIANDPAHDPRSCGRLPPGHPSLDAFLGLPLLRGGEILGSIGLANRAGGYDENLVAELRPVVEACAQLVAACRGEHARRLVEQALRASEQQFRAIFDGANDAIFLHDGETGRILNVNTRVAEMYGWSREEILELSVNDMSAGYAPYSQEQAMGWVARASAVETPVFEWLARHRSGRLFWMEVNMRQFHIDGRPHILVVARDISERKRHSDALRMYERMVSCMPDHLSVLGRDYRYLAVNDTYLQHHGLAREDIIGHSVAELLGQTLFDTLVKEKLDRCLAGKRVHYSDWFDFPVTGRRFVDVTYTPYQDDDGRITGVIVASRDLTDLEQAHQALMETETRYRLMVDQMADALFITDLYGHIVDVNQRACDTLGYTRAELLALNVLEVEQDFDLARATAVWAALQPGHTVTIHGHHRRKEGTTFPVEIRVSCIELNGQRLMPALAHDISERIQAEEKLNQAAVVFDNAQEGVMVTDRNARILAVNPAFCEITGYDEAEVLGETPSKFKSGRHDAAFYQAMWRALNETGRWQGEVWDRRRDGEVYPKWLSISAVRDAEGQIVRYVSLFADITHLKESEARLEHLAHFDVLTDLPNRLLFTSRLEHAIEQARRHGQRIALLFLDLDRFKTVNDSLGHPAGDELLITVAERIRDRLRDEDTLARLGGDEFVVLLEQLDEAQMAAIVAQDVLQVLAAPVQLSGGHEVFIGASIGISLFPDDADNAMRLVSSADAALYQAKEQGRNTYRFYTEALTTAANEHLALETRLRRGLERGEFILHYQPLIDAHSGRAVGVEALVRWQPPGEALVPPDKFIPIAEETGLIVPLGEWILRTACAQARTWLDAGLPPLVMAVNLSGRQFLAADMVELVRMVLAETGLPAQSLELELTESVIMEQADQAIATLDALKALGVRLAIDDFGTGYSSLAYLKRFPIDKLKIDRSFVQGLEDSDDDREIAATIIAMGRSLNLDVLAEGVETEQQLALLRQFGCEQYQGYLFSRPVPAAEFEQWLRERPA
ncbi:MAG: PAS domain S-box protein [Pseudomonadota bacterium]|nr:PAS domain S-box protein [Pseudomonadota bacterium]MDP1904084.1 PAS domain S-box protein [Pseudomonadota bacterium]MDP2354199.1 PAS domain S-box protein [Pseudomonadota bacterium]